MQNHWEVAKIGVSSPNSPEELWEFACDYFKWCDENPVKTKLTITAGTKVGTRVKQLHTRPYTIKGLCLHCGINEAYLKDVYMSKNETSMYYIVVSKILYLIHVQNTEYAMLGIFNPIFTSKVLNMEKEEPTTSNIKIEIVPGLPALSTSENEILEKLDTEKLFSGNQNS